MEALLTLELARTPTLHYAATVPGCHMKFMYRGYLNAINA
jgi:hypothetical protein